MAAASLFRSACLDQHGLRCVSRRCGQLSQIRFASTVSDEKRLHRMENVGLGVDGFARKDRLEKGLQSPDAKLGNQGQKEVTKEVAFLGRQRRWEEALALFRTVQNPDVFLQTAAMAACRLSLQGRCAMQLFDEMTVKTVPAFNVLLALHGRARNLDAAISAFSDMSRHCLSPDAGSYNCMIEAHGFSRDTQGAMRVFTMMEENRFQADAGTYNSMLTACSRNGEKAQAQQLIAKMDADRVPIAERHFTGLIASFANSRDEVAACDAFADLLRRGIAPTVIGYTILIKCFGGSDALPKAEEKVAEMRQAGIRPDVFLFNALLQAAIRSRNWVRFDELVAEMGSLGFPPTHELKNLMQNMEAVKFEDSRTRTKASAQLPVDFTDLPPGWAGALDPTTSRAYYWKVENPAGTTSWERPL